MPSSFNLEQVRIASPCTMKWSQMQGDERTRHCSECKLNVHNLAGLSRVEGEALLARANGGERVCMRIMRRFDGTVITRDCPVGKRIADRLRIRMASIAVSLAGLLWFSIGRADAREMKGSVEVAPNSQTMMGAPTPFMGKVVRAIRPPQTAYGGVAPMPDIQPKPEVRPPADEDQPYVFRPDGADQQPED